MAPNPVDELKAALAAERERLLSAIGGVSEQQFKKRPDASPDDPRPWCIAEVLAHLLHDELVWSRRVELALAQDGAPVEPTNRTAAADAVKAGRQAPVPQLIHGLLAARRALERHLDAAAAIDALQRGVSHPGRGGLSIAWMVNKTVEHEREHVAQIETLRPAVGVTAA
ncbi:MAG: DUF664 domain-containing protein [Dehalococcoidia bacterium]|nr:DUF664 domain-containing protein [Dehalococcoidia bacterium]